VAVPATLLRIVPELQKRVVKVVSIAGGTLKTILNVLRRLAKKGAKTATVTATANRTVDE
jgi:hypothetical protein